LTSLLVLRKGEATFVSFLTWEDGFSFLLSVLSENARGGSGFLGFTSSSSQASLSLSHMAILGVNSLWHLCDILEEEIENSTKQVEQLMQSCLKEVFEEG